MPAPFPNLYTRRKVAETAAKACDVCYKPSSSVLITADKKDFFFVCPAHLKDTYFCTPRIDDAAIRFRRERALAEEAEKLKREYEEKQRKKEEKESGKRKDEQGGKGKTKDGDATKDDATGRKAVEEEAGEPSGGGDLPTPAEEVRMFELKSAFYQQRLQRRRQAEAARRERERVAQPGYFPSVPSEPPTK